MSEEKILLILLPFWDPLIPHHGIACLKSFLQKHGYRVRTRGANIENRFLVLYDRYFDILKKNIPANRQGDFFHLGHFVLQNHLMAHTHYRNKIEYIELVKKIIFLNFYANVSEDQVFRLVDVLDEFYRRLEKYILDLLEEESPTILGISVYKTTLPASLFAFKLTRERYPHITTIMGGGIFADHLAPGSPNFEAVLEESQDYLDKIFVGQGELLLLKFLQGELDKTRRVYTLGDINEAVLDFADMELPDFSDFDVRNRPYICLGSTGSTSCRFQCSFCNEVKFFGKFRKKDVTQTVREMSELYKRYGYQLFFMTDSMLNPIITDLAEEFIKNPAVLYYDGYFRVDKDAGNIENTLLWRRGGFYRARLGVESGSQHVLDLIGKRITPEQIKNTVSSLAYAGIKTTTYWVVGHPGEREEDFKDTLRLAAELKNDTWQAECAPFDYYFSGQAYSDRWADKRMLLYPAEAKDMLVVQTWILDCEPSREETYERIFRFRAHCNQLGIPNPYSLPDIHKADERWRQLHKNAAPPLLDFKKKENYIDECRKVKKFLQVQCPKPDEGDFGF